MLMFDAHLVVVPHEVKAGLHRCRAYHGGKDAKGLDACQRSDEIGKEGTTGSSGGDRHGSSRTAVDPTHARFQIAQELGNILRLLVSVHEDDCRKLPRRQGEKQRCETLELQAP